MKTLKTLVTLALSAIVLTSTAFAATTEDNTPVTILNGVKNITKINVSGNVELILIQSPTESVKVYNNYYAKNALVQQQNGSLHITSFEKEKLTVVAYVNHINQITATDNALVTTKGELNLLSLDLRLKNQATATLNLTVINLSTDVSGNSTLNLSGSANEMYANIENVAKMNLGNFAAETTLVKAKNKPAVAVASDELMLGK